MNSIRMKLRILLQTIWHVKVLIWGAIFSRSKSLLLNTAKALNSKKPTNFTSIFLKYTSKTIAQKILSKNSEKLSKSQSKMTPTRMTKSDLKFKKCISLAIWLTNSPTSAIKRRVTRAGLSFPKLSRTIF
jgi:hypothetical protein